MTEIHWTVARPEGVEDGDVERAVVAAGNLGGRPGLEVAITFVDDEHLARLHREHLDDPARTDVITFDLGPEGEGPQGELYVSVDRALDVAGRRGVAPERELCLYVVHGVLHLCGFDDREEGERERMRAAERAVLEGLGFPPDHAPHELGAD